MSDSEKTKEQLLEEIKKLTEGDINYRLMFKNMINGIAYHKVVTDKTGNPIDYIFLEVNDAFEKLTGLNGKEIIGKKVTEVLPGIENDPSKWIEKYGEVALKRTKIKFESFSETLNKWYSISAYSTQTGYFVTIFEDISKRKNIGEEIDEKEALLNKVGEIAKIGGWEMDLTKEGEASWTKGTYDIIEIDPKEPIPGFKEHLDYYYPEYREMISKKMNDIAETGKPLQFIAKAKTKKGSTIWVEAIAEAIMENGKPVKIQGTLQDITKEKEIEEALKESQTFNETLLNTSPDIIYIYDLVEHRNIYSNEGIIKILGYSVEEVQEMGDELLPSLMHEEDFKVYLNETLPRYQTAKDGELIEHDYRMKHKNGSWRWLHSKESVFERLTDGSPKQIFGIISDVTERKQAEIELKEKSEFIDKIIDSSALSTWISDEHGTAIRVNQACLDFFGATEEEVIGKYNIFKDSVLEKLGFIPDIQKVFEKGEVTNLVIDYNFGEVDHVSVKNATHKIANSIFTPILDINGKVSNVIIQTIDLSEIKNAEKTAIEEKNKAQQYLAIAEVILVSIDSDGIVQLINPKGCEVLGYSEDEIIGKNWFDHFLPERMRKNVKEVSKKVFAGEMESVKYYENEIVTKSGEERLIAWNNSVFKDENGNLIGTLSSGEDITERKQAENTLQETHKRYSAMIENIGDVIAIVGDDGMTKYQSPNIEKWFGWKPEDLIGTSGWDKMHPDDIERIQNEFSKMLEKETASIVEYRFKCKDGIYKWIELTAVNRINDSAINGVLLNYHDITERKQAELAIIESEEKFRKLFQSTSLPLCYVDKDGIIIIRNDRFIKTFGYTEDEIPSLKEWWVKAYPDEKYREWVVQNWESAVEEASKTGNDIESEVYNVTCKDGSIRNIIISGITIEDNFLATFLDITERKQNEFKLAEQSLRLNNIVEGTNAGTWEWNIKIGALELNDRWAEIIGYTLKELEPIDVNTWINSVYPEDLPKANAELEKLFRKEIGYYDVEFRQPHKDGSLRWVNSRGKIVEWSEDGKPIRMSGTHLDITERKQADILLQNEKERIRTILDMVGDPIFVKDNDHHITLANQAFYKMFKLDEKDVIGYTLVEAVPEKERHHFLKVDREVLDTGKPDNREEELTVDGFTSTIITRKIRFIDESGDKFLVGSIHDITERKISEIELQNKNIYIESIMNNMPIGFGVNTIDDGEVKFLNNQFEDIYGWPKEILTNTSIFFEKIFPDPEYREKMMAQIISDMESGDPKRMVWDNLRIVTGSGEERIVKAYNIPLIDQNIMISTVQDVTEQRKSEKELYQSLQREQIQANIVRQAPIAIGYPDGSFENCNKAFSDLTGYSEEELQTISWNEVLTPPKWNDIEAMELQKLSFDNNIIQYEKEYIHKSGKIIPIELVVTAKFDDENNIVHFIGFVKDITELKKHRDHLEEMVKKRTLELETRNKELDNAMKVFVGRELTIRKLQEKIRALEGK